MKRIDEIYDDFEANVIMIKQRRHLMMAVDLVYHSALAFHFQGQLVQKGVAELLIVGDTRTGKSSVVRSLMKHYGMGVYVQGESVSMAGLLGGVDEAGGRRFLKMGRLPMCHRRLIVIDEANEMEKELIGKLSGVRSTGIYDVMKIQSGSFPALVRQIWIANTRSDKQVADFACGVEAIPNVIGKPEDIARFDLAICLSHRDVDREALYESSRNRHKVEHKFTSGRCQALLQWVWSRKADQVVIDSESEDAILRGAMRLSDKYHSSIPLVIETEQRVKVARLSVAYAARLFSTDREGKDIIVRTDHVRAVVDFIDALYSSDTMAYDVYSRMQKSCGVGEGMGQVCEALGRVGVETLLTMEVINKADMSDIFNDKDSGNQAFHLLLLNRGFKRDHGGRRRLTSQCISYMKEKCRGDLDDFPDTSKLSSNVEKEEEHAW